jgi:rubrerythrin
MGGRSRVAAQMLAGKGFDNVHNVKGGFKAWQGEAAFGKEELGLELLTGNESPDEALVVAYSLEEGLRDFYLSMIPTVKSKEVKNIFKKLSEIETKHQERILKEYIAMTGKSISREEFEKGIVSQAIEGGLTTQEYAELFQPDWESVKDIIGLAMSIEAQALDLYMRTADRCSDPQTKKILAQIAEEERMHLTQLGRLMDNV